MSRVITFYSYKGGVGRSMALANIGVVLAQWGYKVIMIDWDLEAPGLEYFFDGKYDTEKAKANLGIVNILIEKASWKECIIPINVGNNITLNLISAGKRDDHYYEKVRSFDVTKFYNDEEGGEYIESLRSEWKEEYDFILVDSRTGVTDIGGICTIHLPDLLVLLFTATKQGFKGILDVAEKTFRNQQEFPVDRMEVLSLPIASRIEAGEDELAKASLTEFSTSLEAIYSRWLPASVNRFKFTENVFLPHIPKYSYGENLAVFDKRSGPGTLKFSYESIAALLSNDLDNADLFVNDRTKYLKLAKKSYREKLKGYINTLSEDIDKSLKGIHPDLHKRVFQIIPKMVAEELKLADIDTIDERVLSVYKERIIEKIGKIGSVNITFDKSTQTINQTSDVIVTPTSSPPVSATKKSFYMAGAAIIIISLLAATFFLARTFKSNDDQVTYDSVTNLLASSAFRDSAEIALTDADSLKAGKYLLASANKALDARDTVKALNLLKQTKSINDSITYLNEGRTLLDVARKKYKSPIMKITVFYVKTKEQDTEPKADLIIEHLKGYSNYIVDKKAFPEKLLGTPSYVFDNEIRYNNEESREAELLLKRLNDANVVGDMKLKKISYSTPFYISVFIGQSTRK